MEIVKVDFELFNYDPQIDFHGVKTLLRQLLDADAQLLDLSGLSDLIVGQNTIGSTCKVDDKANDAYAFLTVLNVGEHRAQKACVAQLVEYLVDRARASSDPKLGEAVSQVLGADSKAVVGVVFSERLLNMPAEVIPPMWSMLVDEIEAAVEDKEPYEFTHYLVVSRGYYEVASSLDEKRKQKKAREETKLQYFHPEDEEMRKHAAAAGTYPFTKEDESVADSKRAFQEMGVKPTGFMMLIEAPKFGSSVKAIGDYVGSAA